MIKQSELTKEQYTIGEVAAFLNINVKIIVVKDASKEKSIREELTKDMTALIAFFPSKNLQDIKLDDENFNISEIFE